MRRVLLIVVGVAAALVLAVAAGLLISAAVGSRDTEVKEPPAQPPLAKMKVMQTNGRTYELFATLAPGARLDQVVNLELFEDFDPEMTVQSAQQRLGPPAGQWHDSFCRAAAPFYERPDGRVSLCQYPTEGALRWATVGYPRPCSAEYPFRDVRLLEQLAPWLSVSDWATVHVLRQAGWGGVTVKMSRASCEWVVLSARD